MTPAITHALPPAALADPLAGLRGYHLPQPISWWPPALGWGLLALLLLLLAGGALGWWLQRRRRHAAARCARAELATLRAALAEGGDAAGFARGLSRLLRRFALTRFPRHQVAGLTGEDWLRFLDAHGGEERFREGPGRLLVEAPYRPAGPLPTAELAALVADWIGRNADRAQRSGSGFQPRSGVAGQVDAAYRGTVPLPPAASDGAHHSARETRT